MRFGKHLVQPLKMRARSMSLGAFLYCTWAFLAISLSLMSSGLSRENTTRILVLLFLLGQILGRKVLLQIFAVFSPKTRYILMATLLAAVVEGLHMISRPVFPALRIDLTTPLTQALYYYALDLLFTLPAYVLIFTLMWRLINRHLYSFWQYVLIMALAQTLGDGGLFYFYQAPAMLCFLPYPMTNYHSLNVLPFLAVRKELKDPKVSKAKFFVTLPAVIGLYLICGAVIHWLGKSGGFL